MMSLHLIISFSQSSSNFYKAKNIANNINMLISFEIAAYIFKITRQGKIDYTGFYDTLSLLVFFT